MLGIMRPFILLITIMLTGCSSTVTPPAPVRVAGQEVGVASSIVTERLDFAKHERRLSINLIVEAHEFEPDPDRFGRPVLSLTQIYDERGTPLGRGSDGYSLTSKIAQGLPQRDDAGPTRINRGAGLDDRVPRRVRVEGTLEHGRITSRRTFDLPLEMATTELTDRLSVATDRGTLANGQERVSVRVHVDVVDVSLAAPNAPVRIEIIDEAGEPISVLDHSTGQYGNGRIDKLFSTLIDDRAAAVRLHVVTAMDWLTEWFVLEDVPLRGRLE